MPFKPEKNEKQSKALPAAGAQPAGGGEAVLALPMRREKKRGPLGMAAAAIGRLLYTLGFSAEYVLMQLWRVLRIGGGFVWQLLVWMARRIGSWLVGFFKGLGHDIAEPFVDFRRRRRLLSKARQRAARRGSENTAHTQNLKTISAKTHLALAARILGFAMPLAAAAVLVIIIQYLVNIDYGLKVVYNGHELGYVTDQSVVDNAKGLLRDRIRLAPNQELSDWQLNPDYTIARTAEFTTTQQLVNNILLTSTDDPGDLTEAIGVFVDGRLFSVTKEPEQLQAYLDAILAEHQQTAPEGAEVRFRRAFTYDDPAEEPVYFTTSVEDFETLTERFGENVSEEVRFTADGAMTLEDIAHDNGLPLATLLVRNPQIATLAGVSLPADALAGPAAAEEETLVEEDVDGGAYIPEVGTALLIRRAQPFLQVETTIQRRSVEAIPFTTQETETDERLKGTRTVIQQGEVGEREVWDEYVYVDGELDDTIRLDDKTVVLKDPVDEIVELGTRDIISGGAGPGIGGGGGYTFPVPTSPYSSRGFSGGHQALDINAAGGEPIYACAGGTVTVSGWHYSYGYYIVIDHGGGINTLYAHCSALYIGAGEAVSQGQNIAAVGSTGNSTGNHLHLEVTVNGARVDPVPYVGYPY